MAKTRSPRVVAIVFIFESDSFAQFAQVHSCPVAQVPLGPFLPRNLRLRYREGSRHLNGQFEDSLCRPTSKRRALLGLRRTSATHAIGSQTPLSRGMPT